MDTTWELWLSKKMNITRASESSKTGKFCGFIKKVPGIPLAERFLTLFKKGFDVNLS